MQNRQRELRVTKWQCHDPFPRGRSPLCLLPCSCFYTCDSTYGCHSESFVKLAKSWNRTNSNTSSYLFSLSWSLCLMFSGLVILNFFPSLQMHHLLTCLLHLAYAETSIWNTLCLSHNISILASTYSVDDACSWKPSLTIRMWASYVFFIIPYVSALYP